MSAGRNAEAPSRLSGVTAAISGVLVALLVGYLVIHALQADDPPAIAAVVVPEAGWSRDGRTYLAIDVTNVGDRSARDVQLQIVPSGEGAAAGQAIIDYLAGGETSRIYVVVPEAVRSSSVEERGGREVDVLVLGFKES